jgi:7-keto-8-aminopelargonate synthetase-like enzyme
MDGDLAPLPGMLALCERHGALLVVDDAHGTGVVGEGGRGAAALLGVAGAPRLVQVGTLSKAFGVAGGFVAGTRLLRDLLVNRARAFVFDTALAPPCAGAALAALNVIRDEPDRIGKLARNSRQLRNRLRERGFPVEDHPSAIIPVVLGDAGVALDVATRLRNAGFLVVAIRPPTVPRGTSRIRVTVMATHEPAQVEALVNAIANAVPGTPVTR